MQRRKRFSGIRRFIGIVSAAAALIGLGGALMAEATPVRALSSTRGSSRYRRSVPRGAGTEPVAPKETEPSKPDSQRCMDVATRLALGATEPQWEAIAPRLEKVRSLSESGHAGTGSYVRTDPADGASGRRKSPATSRVRPGLYRDDGKSAEARALYQELVRLLRSGRAQPARITEKVARIRRIRATIQRQSAQAKQELRQVVTPRQEATLILMGYLD